MGDWCTLRQHRGVLRVDRLSFLAVYAIHDRSRGRFAPCFIPCDPRYARIGAVAFVGPIDHGFGYRFGRDVGQPFDARSDPEGSGHNMARAPVAKIWIATQARTHRCARLAVQLRRLDGRGRTGPRLKLLDVAAGTICMKTGFEGGKFTR